MSRLGWTLLMGALALGCTDSTAPLARAPSAPMLSSGKDDAPGIETMTVHGDKGDRTVSLVGSELILPNGLHRTVTAKEVAQFRSVKKVLDGLPEMEKRLRPLWAKLKLADPFKKKAGVSPLVLPSTPSSALARYGLTPPPAANPDVVIVPPCDANCAPDPTQPPPAPPSDGAGSGLCETLGLSLYNAIQSLHQWENNYANALDRWNLCLGMLSNPLSGPSCGEYSALLESAAFWMNYYAARMYSAADAITYYGCAY